MSSFDDQIKNLATQIHALEEKYNSLQPAIKAMDQASQRIPQSVKDNLKKLPKSVKNAVDEIVNQHIQDAAVSPSNQQRAINRSRSIMNKNVRI